MKDNICFAITIAVFLVVAFIAGGFLESLRHPEIVQEQGITIRELRNELNKRQEFSLQMDDKWDLIFSPDDKSPVWFVWQKKRPLTQLQKDAFKARQKAVESINLTIAGAGDNTLQSEGK